MNTYIGTKTIKATPMNREDYIALRGWTVPVDENPADEGFLVEYTDGGKSNVEGYEGYVSWLQTDVFEQSYKMAESFVDRLKIERDELSSRSLKLQTFLSKGKPEEISFGSWDLLTNQHQHMTAYLKTLEVRINVESAISQPPSE